jgi:hypothetical protein
VGAKAPILIFAAVALAGCSGGLKRFAPPGFVKYEDRAKGQPVAPSIAARIEEAQATGGGHFPKLSEQPAAAPAGVAAPEQTAFGDELEAVREALLNEVEADRAAAAAERADSLEIHKEALDEALRKDDAAARKERGLPPAPPPIKD